MTILERYEKFKKLKNIVLVLLIVGGASVFALLPMALIVSDIVDPFGEHGFDTMNIALVGYPIAGAIFGISAIIGAFVIIPKITFLRDCNYLIKNGRQELLEVPIPDNPVFTGRLGYKLYITNGLIYTSGGMAIPLADVERMYGLPEMAGKGMAKMYLVSLSKEGMTVLDRDCYICFVWKDGHKSTSAVMRPKDANMFVDAIMSAKPDIFWGKLGENHWNEAAVPQTEDTDW